MAEITEKKVVAAKSADIDYGKSLSWFFNDPKFWNTVLKASLLMLSMILIIPIIYVAPLFVGYTLHLIRNIQNGVYELPELGEEGQWQDGIVLALLGFGLSFILGLIIGGGSVATMFAAAQNGADPETLNNYSSLANIPGMLSRLFQSLLAVMAMPMFAKTRDIGSLFNIGNYQAIWEANGAKIVIVAVLVYVLSSVIPAVGFLALCIGVLPASFIVTIMKGSLYGELDVSNID